MDGQDFEYKMARHWLPVQGFDEDLADSVLGASTERFEVMSNPGEIEEVSVDLVCLLTFIH